MPWAPPGSKQVLATMHEFDGTPSFMDPRAILASVLKRYDDRGLTPVVATELEFYVVEDNWRETGKPMPPKPPMAPPPKGRISIFGGGSASPSSSAPPIFGENPIAASTAVIAAHFRHADVCIVSSQGNFE